LIGKFGLIGSFCSIGPFCSIGQLGLIGSFRSGRSARLVGSAGEDRRYRDTSLDREARIGACPAL
jgi:hypothetical protein